MWLMIAAVFVGVFALSVLIVTAKGDVHSEKVQKRLSELEFRIPPAPDEELPTDIRKEERVSRVAWLNRWLTSVNPAALELFLYQADVKSSAGGLVTMSLAAWAAIGFVLYLRTGAGLISLAVSAIVLPLPFVYVLRKRASRLMKFEQILPEALEMMVSALRVGHSLVSAIQSAGDEVAEPVGREFRKCFDEQNFGIDLRKTMVNLAHRVPVQDVRIFVAAVLIQKESGGNLAEVLEKVAITTRQRFKLKKQIMVHTAQGRATGWVLSLLPVVLGVAMYVVHPEGISVLWTRPVGLKLLWTAIGMEVVGALVIRNIVRIRV